MTGIGKIYFNLIGIMTLPVTILSDKSIAGFQIDAYKFPCSLVYVLLPEASPYFGLPGTLTIIHAHSCNKCRINDSAIHVAA